MCDVDGGECGLDGLDCDADPACTGGGGGCVPTANNEKGPRCSNGLDDDCDSLIDGADPDCLGAPAFVQDTPRPEPPEAPAFSHLAYNRRAPCSLGAELASAPATSNTPPSIGVGRGG